MLSHTRRPSMAAVYGYSEAYFRAYVLPKLGFVRREGPVRLSCQASLQADAVQRRTEARARQSEAGRTKGAENLRFWILENRTD